MAEAGAGDAGVAPAGASGVGVADGVGVAGALGARSGSVPSGAEAGTASPSGLACREDLASSASAIDVQMKMVARITVVRVRTFAAPRPDIRPPTPPPEPSPRPPPSERCSRITPIMAMQTMTSMVRRTAYMHNLSWLESESRPGE